MSIPTPRIRTVPAALTFLLVAVCPPLLTAQRLPVDSTFTAALSSFDTPAPASQQAFRPPVTAGIVGGTLGSAVGVAGGAIAGYAMATCSPTEWLCGFGEATVGALVGSVIGSTLGANIGARRGGASPTFESTVVGGLLGVLTGIAGGALMNSLAPDGPGALIGFTVGQGLVTGLFAARRR